MYVYKLNQIYVLFQYDPELENENFWGRLYRFNPITKIGKIEHISIYVRKRLLDVLEPSTRADFIKVYKETNWIKKPDYEDLLYLRTPEIA